MSRREVTRIEPRSAVRVGFFIGLVIGLLFGLYSAALLKGMSESSLSLLGGADAAQIKSLGSVSTIFLMIFMGLIGALLHSLIAGLCAIVYNLSARMFGGLEYHVEEIPESGSTTSDHSEND